MELDEQEEGIGDLKWNVGECKKVLEELKPQ